MKKRIVIAAGVFAAVLLAVIVWALCRPASVSNRADVGIVTFERLNDTDKQQVFLPKGRQNIRVALRKGSLTVRIKDRESILFEERYSGDVVDVTRLVVPKDGNYTLILIGSRAAGTVDYPISLASRSAVDAASPALSQETGETETKNVTNTPAPTDDATAGDAGAERSLIETE